MGDTAIPFRKRITDYGTVFGCDDAVSILVFVFYNTRVQTDFIAVHCVIYDSFFQNIFAIGCDVEIRTLIDAIELITVNQT